MNVKVHGKEMSEGFSDRCCFNKGPSYLQGIENLSWIIDTELMDIFLASTILGYFCGETKEDTLDDIIEYRKAIK